MRLALRIDERGFTLISILSWVIVMAILLSSMVYAAKLNLDISQREDADVDCYAVVRGVSQTVLNAMQAAQPVTPRTLDLNGVQINEQIVADTRLIRVKVEGTTGKVTDTISFTYDTIAHRLRAWQDNGPGFVE